MSQIREHFRCTACQAVTRTDWSNPYLPGFGYDPDNLACPACGHTPLTHQALEIEDGSEIEEPILSRQGQASLDSSRGLS